MIHRVSKGGCVLKAAFSLIELLVTVAVIGILAGLLLPALGRAKGAAQSARCSNNIRQILLGTTLYAADYACFPLFLYEANSRVICWPDEIRSYTGASWSNDLYRCSGFPWTNQPAPQALGAGYGGYGSYDMNADGVFEMGPSSIRSLGIGGRCAPALGEYQALREARVAAPAEMIGFGDSLISRALALNRTYYFSLPLYLHTRGDMEARVAEARRHSGKWNTGFCDGHVESLWPASLFDTSDQMLARWNYDHQPNRGYIRP